MINDKITLQELASALSEKEGLSKKDAELLVKGLFDLVEEALNKEKYVKVKGLGIFKLIEVGSRESINVNTGERFEIQGHTKITFTPETSLKELINKPFAHFETVILNEGTVLEDTMEEEIVNEEKIEENVDPIEETPVSPKEASIPKASESIEEELVSSVIVGEDSIEEIEENEPPLIEQNEKSIEEKLTTEPTATIEDVASIKEEVISVKEDEKTNKGLIAFTILLILIILAGVYWLFKPTDNEKDKIPAKTEITIEESISEDVQQQNDTVTPVQMIDSTTASIQTSEEKVASLSDTTDYVITGTKATHILQNGETLIRVSLKYFGTKNYWPYIAKHNENRIKDANNVPVGTNLLIPELAQKE